MLVMTEVREMVSPDADRGALPWVWLRRSWVPLARGRRQTLAGPLTLRRPRMGWEGRWGRQSFWSTSGSLTRVCLLCSPYRRGDWDGRG